MASIYSTSSNPLATKMRHLSILGKPAVAISLNGEHGSYLTSYSNLDKIEGQVSVTAPNDTRFDELEISLIGISAAYVDKFNTAPTMSARTDAKHLFLKLRQPVNQFDLPSPQILEAGRTYQFPFTFVIPTQLLPRSCQRFANNQIRAAHLQLPPSMGDSSVSGYGGKLLDDLAPEMAKVSYKINVRITRDRQTDEPPVCVVESSKKIRVKPAFEEQPPLAMDPKDSSYRLREEKTIRKGMLKSKLGRLVIETQQPRGLCLPGPRNTEYGPITSSAKVTLRFDPADDTCAPPKLGSLASKLRATTFYSTTPRTNFPHRDTAFVDFAQGIYYEAVPLSTRCMAGAQWEKHSSAPGVVRRDSGCSCSSTNSKSSASHPAASSTYIPGSTYYTTTLIVPLQLPVNKTWIPTFHSCLISRVYRLDLVLSINATTSLSVKVPIQISSTGSVEGNEERAQREEEAAATLQRRLEEAEEIDAQAALLADANESDSTTSDESMPPAFESVAATEVRRGSRGEGVPSRSRSPPAYSALPPPHTTREGITRNVLFMAL
ncbi:hypothetical protein IWX90DRAFT_237580 [Phyllosticta citrichinensis]|uniref:Bul1 C-terminal domain-containing protein n=1 Tax=Phyllosticta citrichinensis TaxID=1130410 RepID=A0ABR1XPY3_9PEZI